MPQMYRNQKVENMAEFLKTRFAYHFAHHISALVYGEDDYNDELSNFYPINDIHDFYADLKKISAPSKDTLLHGLIRQYIYSIYEHSTSKFPEPEHYKLLLAEAGLKSPKWMDDFDDFREHVYEADKLIEKAIKRITPTVFHILFSDRNFLFAFQSVVQQFIKPLKQEDHAAILSRDGVIKRAKYLPGWLKNALFYRDKGHCQLCNKDLKNLISPTRPGDIHLDHMVPLAMGGSNDPTNFQLTCARCNNKKRATNKIRAPLLMPFWEP